MRERPRFGDPHEAVRAASKREHSQGLRHPVSEMTGDRAMEPVTSGAVLQLLPPHAPAIVTGFIDIGSQWRSTAKYVALGEQLLQLGLPTVLYLDESLTVDAPPQTTVIPTRFADCWLAGRVPKGIRLPAGANAAKDTLDYLIIMH